MMCGWRRGRRQCSWQRQIRAHAAVTISELREAAVGQPVFMAERTRRALAKLTVEERWLFSTTLRAGPFEDLLYTDEQLLEEINGVQVAGKRTAEESLVGGQAESRVQAARAGAGTIPFGVTAGATAGATAGVTADTAVSVTEDVPENVAVGAIQGLRRHRGSKGQRHGSRPKLR